MLSLKVAPNSTKAPYIKPAKGRERRKKKMKAKEAVSKIKESGEYKELVDLISQLKDLSVPPADVLDRIQTLYKAVAEMVSQAEREFLEQVTRSYRPKDQPTKIYASATKNVKAACDAFARQVKEQLPTFTLLFQVIQIEKK